MAGAYLEILTRTFGGRPRLLERCEASLHDLEDPDWIQRVIFDDQRRGVAWACGNLATIEASGSWVWVLDDDDLCIDPGLIGRIRAIEEREDPDVIAVQVDHGVFGLLPPASRWLQAPACGQIGPSNVIVRREVWDRCRHGWIADYAGDFYFADTLWQAGLRWSWLDVIAAEQPAQMIGECERAS